MIKLLLLASILVHHSGPYNLESRFACMKPDHLLDILNQPTDAQFAAAIDAKAVMGVCAMAPEAIDHRLVQVLSKARVMTESTDMWVVLLEVEDKAHNRVYMFVPHPLPPWVVPPEDRRDDT